MPNISESKALEIVTRYPSYSGIQSGSSVLEAMSIDHKGVPNFEYVRVDWHRWPVILGICQVGISC